MKEYIIHYRSVSLPLPLALSSVVFMCYALHLSTNVFFELFIFYEDLHIAPFARMHFYLCWICTEINLANECLFFSMIVCMRNLAAIGPDSTDKMRRLF